MTPVYLNLTIEQVLTTFQVSAIHRIGDKQVVWPFEEESAGTQKLFGLVTQILLALQIGSLTIVDELDSRLHPTIIHELIQLFQNLKTNPKDAQLIFTSHDNTLQRNDLLRRDQIWFTQKRSDFSTELYSLADFKDEEDLAIDRAYLDGRFGAVPCLPTDEDLMRTLE